MRVRLSVLSSKGVRFPLFSQKLAVLPSALVLASSAVRYTAATGGPTQLTDQFGVLLFAGAVALAHAALGLGYALARVHPAVLRSSHPSLVSRPFAI